MSNEMPTSATIETVVRDNQLLNNPATLRGVESLLIKLAPLIQGERFHNIVDLASALSDVVNMADQAMVEKLAHDYESLMSAAFTLNNALRYASAQAAAEGAPPSLWQTMRRLNRDPDARRGLVMILHLLALLGRDARLSEEVVAAAG